MYMRTTPSPEEKGNNPLIISATDINQALSKRFNLFQQFHAPAVHRKVRYFTIPYCDKIKNNNYCMDHWKKRMEKKKKLQQGDRFYLAFDYE